MTINDKTLVVDVTYKCNLRCRYCKWSIDNKVIRDNIESNKITISTSILDALEIGRVVFSGGEPLLRDDIYNLINHYNKIGLETILITNGLKISDDVLNKLIKSGLDGLTFSIDSLDFEVLSNLRKLKKEEFNRVVNFISTLGRKNNGLEIGINTTLTPLNISNDNIQQLYEFVLMNDLNFIKFQPFFDDGYRDKCGKELLFEEENTDEIKKNAEITERYLKKGVNTNPTNFWHDINDLIIGKTLDPNNCSALEHQVMLIEGGLQSCYWKPNFKFKQKNIEKEYMRDEIVEYKKSLNRCKVDYRCFCNQPLNHTWSDQK